jgi:hypothetical protein
VSWLSIALLAAAVVILIGAEWPRLSTRFGAVGARRHERARRKDKERLRLIRSEPMRSESEEFAASVERDLEQLPTIEERDQRR